MPDQSQQKTNSGDHAKQLEANQNGSLTRQERLKEQRSALPDEPGVYLFRGDDETVLYVGKARSLSKRIASHFVNPVTRGAVELVDLIDSIEVVLVDSETEALLVEIEFIKQYQPQFNIRLRDDKSYPYVAVTLDEPYPRVYMTREAHRTGRRYFGPYSNAKRVRHTLDLLGRLFQYRTCEGKEPGRRSGSPCLDYHIARCTAPCVGYISQEEYRHSIDGIMAFLSGRYGEIERSLQAQMNEAAAEQDYERAARERDRLLSVRSLLERQEVNADGNGSLDLVALTVDGDDANIQIFQVRDGSLVDRQSFYLRGVVAPNTEPAGNTTNSPAHEPADSTEQAPGSADDLINIGKSTSEEARAEVANQFLLRYYASASIPPVIAIAASEQDRQTLSTALTKLRNGPVEVIQPQRGNRKRLLEMARRNSELALGQERLKDERKRQQRITAVSDLQKAINSPRLPMRVECFDISHLMGSETVASMVVLDGGTTNNSNYRRFVIKSLQPGVPDDFASMAEVLGRRVAAWERMQELDPEDKEYDESFAALPDVVVIDGGKGQLSSAIAQMEQFVERGVAVISLAKRIEEVFLPGKSQPVILGHDTPALQLLQRARDEAHRFAITHHRKRRDSKLTGSILDGLTGIGDKRKQALIKQFGSPDGVLKASREELELTPGIPGKIARDIYTQLHRSRTGR